MSERSTIALNSDKTDPFSPASKLLSLPFPLTDRPSPTLSLSLNITPTFEDSTTRPYRFSKAMTAEIYCILFRDK